MYNGGKIPARDGGSFQPITSRSCDYIIRKVCTRGNFILPRRSIEPARERKKMAFSLDLKRVLISDSVDSCCKTILEANGIAVDLKTKLTKEELLVEIPVSETKLNQRERICVLNRYFFSSHCADLFSFQNYDGLIVRSATKVTAEVIKAGKNLKIIGRAGTGVDNIDIPAASLQGIIVMK